MRNRHLVVRGALVTAMGLLSLAAPPRAYADDPPPGACNLYCWTDCSAYGQSGCSAAGEGCQPGICAFVNPCLAVGLYSIYCYSAT